MSTANQIRTQNPAVLGILNSPTSFERDKVDVANNDPQAPLSPGNKKPAPGATVTRFGLGTPAMSQTPGPRVSPEKVVPSVEGPQTSSSFNDFDDDDPDSEDEESSKYQERLRNIMKRQHEVVEEILKLETPPSQDQLQSFFELSTTPEKFTSDGRFIEEIMRWVSGRGLLSHPSLAQSLIVEDETEVEARKEKSGDAWRKLYKILAAWNIPDSDFKELERFANDSNTTLEDIENLGQDTLRNGRWVNPTDLPPPEEEMDHEPNYPSGDEAFYKSIYEMAEPALHALVSDFNNKKAIGRIEQLNKRIEKHNKDKGLANTRTGKIKLKSYMAYFQSCTSLSEQIAVSTNSSAQEALKIQWETANESIKQFNKREGYPQSWVPTPRNLTMSEKLQISTAETDAANEAMRQAAITADTNAAAAAATAAAAAKHPNIARPIFPWTTMDLPSGERIIAGRRKKMFGIDHGAMCIVETAQSNDLSYIFRDDLSPAVLSTYFSTTGIKLLGEKNDKRQRVKVWSVDDRNDYVRLVFAVVGRRKISNLSKRATTLAPETQCCVEMRQGLEIMDRSDLKRVVGYKAGDSEIDAYCNLKSITPPREVESEEVIIPRARLARMEADTTTSMKFSGTTSPTATNPAIVSLQTSIAVLEKKFDNMKLPNNLQDGRSLEQILLSIDGRLGKVESSMEAMTKVASFWETRLNALEAKAT